MDKSIDVLHVPQPQSNSIIKPTDPIKFPRRGYGKHLAVDVNL